MKREIFKNMYGNIGLSEEQKDRIYQEIGAAEESGSPAKKVRFTARAAAFAVLFLLSGMTVLAVSRLSLEDRFAEAMHPWHEHNLTPEQKGFYEQYGKVLDNEIETYYGTLKLEASLYDDYYLIVPYSYDLDTEDGDREEWSGIGINGLAFVTNVNSDDISDPINHIRYSDSAGDGIISGSYICSPNDDETFEPDEVIQVYAQNGRLSSPDKFLTEFTLGSKVDRVNLTIDEPTRKALEEKGMMVEELSVSPISINYSFISRFQVQYPVSVVLKDGSVVEHYSGGGYHGNKRKEGKLKDEYPYLIDYSYLFTTPIDLDEVDGIRITAGNTDIWIPVKKEN